MNIENTYNDVLVSLKKEKRPLLKQNDDDFKELFLALGNSLNSIEMHESKEMIKKVLCILDHTTNHSPIFEGILCKILKSKDVPTDLKVYTLSTTQKFIIQRRNFMGEPLPSFYIDTLSDLLDVKDPELYEWTLRTIDEMGVQGKKLVHKILKTRPRFLQMLKKHNQNSHDIIEMLLVKWGFRE